MIPTNSCKILTDIIAAQKFIFSCHFFSKMRVKPQILHFCYDATVLERISPFK